MEINLVLELSYLSKGLPLKLMDRTTERLLPALAAVRSVGRLCGRRLDGPALVLKLLRPFGQPGKCRPDEGRANGLMDIPILAA